MRVLAKALLVSSIMLMGAWGISVVLAQKPGSSSPGRPPTAEQVSRRYLTTHPRPRDEAEKSIIAVMDDMQTRQAQGMGNVHAEDGRLMRMLCECVQAQHVVEVGTANGYSTLWFCLALRSTGGRITTHEIDSTRIALAKENFRRAGVEDLVTLVPGDAHETLSTLKGPVDVILLDAEKAGFVDYLQQLLPLLKAGGLVIAHDSSGHADQMDAYFQMITTHEDLETVFVDASHWGMAVSRKMR